MINYGRHYIDKKDVKSVVDTLKSDFLTQGPKVKIFENKIKKFLGSKFTLAVNSGTAALHLACISLGLKKGDLIVSTPITFLSSVNSALYLNATPIFIDIDKKNYCLDLKKLEQKLIELKKLKKKIKVLIITDYAGQTSDWKKIKFLSVKYNFKTINDNCHSLGSKYYKDQRYAVKYADVVTHSFHPVKLITTGEGGSLSTNNKKIYNKVLELRSHGVLRNNFLKKKFGSWFYSMEKLGYNYRMSDINASLGISQLQKVNKFLRKRKKIAGLYYNGFSKNNNITLPFIEKFCDHSFHLFPVQIDFKKISIDKKKFFKLMFEKNINLQVHYIPIYLQKYYRKRFKYRSNLCPVAEKFYKNTFSLPIYFSLKKEQVYKIINQVNKLTS